MLFSTDISYFNKFLYSTVVSFLCLVCAITHGRRLTCLENLVQVIALLNDIQDKTSALERASSLERTPSQMKD